MSFATLTYLLFLPLVFGIYWLFPKRIWQNAVLLVASYIFYSWWDWRFCGLMVASSLIDFVAGHLLETVRPPTRKKVLWVALSFNLIFLGIFKYFNFFVDSLVIGLSTIGLDVPTATFQILLPVGISFYTFQTMSYTIDIYRGDFSGRRNLVDYLSFVAFFPQLVAGPIERARHLLPQFEKTRTFSHAEAEEGCKFILWGLTKKLLIADNLAVIVNEVYVKPTEFTGLILIIGTISFAFQIYCDFSGYSDIAVGSAKLFNIHLSRNFAYPYFSFSVTEFWRRWHITLSTWFRDYIYFPLGGNKKGLPITLRNLFITAFISGIWHGAGWNFIIWGSLHGIYLVSERIIGVKAHNLKSVPGEMDTSSSFKGALQMLYTFSLINIAWVFFRADSVEKAFLILSKIAMDILHLAPLAGTNDFLLKHRAVFLLLACFIVVEWLNRRRWNPLSLAYMKAIPRWAVYTSIVWSILLFGALASEDFIYFQF